MITLFTGGPGAGKTSYIVKLLLEERRKAEAAGVPMRPVFAMGVTGLCLPHEMVPPVSDWVTHVPALEDPTLLEAVFTFPDGSLVIIDECQKVYPNRSSTSKVPPIVSAFEKHRHKGLDFWLITQAPALIDPGVRKLVGKHIHLRSQWSGRTLLEWEVTSDPESITDRSRAAVRRYKLPKEVFSFYKSATIHVKQSRRVPFAVYAGLVAFCLFLIFGYRFYQSRFAEVPKSVSVPALGPSPGVSVSQSPGVSVPLTAESFEPRLKMRPESAPVYDAIRQVKSLPVVAGCLKMRERCSCFTDQGTDVHFSTEMCEAWLSSPPFDPFRDRSGVGNSQKKEVVVSGT